MTPRIHRNRSLPRSNLPVNPDSLHVVSRPLSKKEIRNVALLAGGPHAAFIRHNNDTIVEFCQEVIVSKETRRPSSGQDQKHRRRLLSSEVLIEAMHRFRRFAHAYRLLEGPDGLFAYEPYFVFRKRAVNHHLLVAELSPVFVELALEPVPSPAEPDPDPEPDPAPAPEPLSPP